MDNDRIEACFRKEGIDRVRRLVDEYAFTLVGIPETIRLRFYRDLAHEGIEAEQSHYMQAPGMALPAVSETQRYRSMEEALDELLGEFLAGYRAAIEAGHRPDTNWLLPNRDFN